MARWLKLSTTVTLRYGPFLDDTDFKTEETALTPTVELSKAGGAFAARNSATATAHDSNGWYSVELNTTDTNTVGPLTLKVDAAGHLPVWEHFMVVPAVVYDSLVGGTDTLQVDVTQFNGTNGTFASGRAEVNLSHIAGVAVSTTTAQLGVNVVQISGDATAADNAESYYDGTGYAGTGNTIPTVTTVTNTVSANAVQISGDSVAADNLEAALDGTGGVTITAAHVGNITGNLSGSVGSVTGSVGSVAAGGITAASHAAGAFDAASVASDAIDEFWDEPIEGALTARQLLRVLLAAMAGKSAEHELGTPKYRDQADTKDRISATTDGDGNRDSVTVDGT